jgi:hypothetical protein
MSTLRVDNLVRTDGTSMDVGNSILLADLVALTGTDGQQVTTSGRTAIGDGGGGTFIWDSSDLSTEVTADTKSGIYVAPTSDTTGASGAWVRQHSGSVNVKWWGAKGDGVTNDTAAFQAAAAYINSQGGGKLVVPYGTAIVHDQTIDTSAGTQYYNSVGHVLGFSGCNGLIVEFQGSILKTQAGLSFGSFDPETGIRYDAPAGGFTDYSYAAILSSTINLNDCHNVTIINADFDGNIVNQNIGGYWGDVGIQLDHTGIRLDNCTNITITNPKAHYYGLDNLYITATTGVNFKMGITVTNGDFQYAGRQAFSWTGGDWVTFINTKFMNTQRNGSVSSPPGAGMDIEDNGNGAKDGTFISCTFADNAGAELLILRGAANIEFINCTVAGGNRGIWNNSTVTEPKINFTGCTIHGNIVNPGKDSIYSNCYISDKQLLPYLALTERLIDNGNATENTVFKDCSIVGTKVSFIYIAGAVTTFLNSKIHCRIDSVAASTRIGVFVPAKVIDTKIIDELTNSDVCLGDTSHAWFYTAGKGKEIYSLYFVGDRVSSNTDGPVNFDLSNTRSGALSNQTIYIGDNASSITLPLGIGTKLVTLSKATGNDYLRYVSAVILVCSAASGVGGRHNSVILAKSIYDLGGGDIVISVNNQDFLTITSSGATLLGEQWELSTIELASFSGGNVLPFTGADVVTLPL